MRVSSTLVGFAGAVAGMAAAVVSYQSTAVVDEAPEHTSIAVPAVGRPLPDPPPRIRTTLAECVPPAKLEDGACVTHVVQKVPVAAAQPVAAVPPPAPPPAPPSVAAPAVAERETPDDSEAAEEAEERAEEAAEEAEDRAEERAEAREESCRGEGTGDSSGSDDGCQGEPKDFSEPEDD